MSYFIPDPTGVNPAYKVPNLKKRIITNNQVVELFTAVYLDSIEATLEGTINKPFMKDIDWEIRNSDYDYDAMGRMQLLDSNYNKILVKSFTVLKPFVAPYNLNVSFNQLYPNEIGYILENPNKNIDITPEVILALLRDVDNLKMATAPVDDIHAAAERQPMLLPPDPNKEYKSNLIPNELWNINTSAKKKVIFPLAGSFFREGVVLARGKYDSVEGLDVNLLFVEGRDYIITGADAYGIKNTSVPSGVYNLIIFITDYVGDVTVSYHAYGGQVTQQDIRAVAESLTNMYSYLTAAQLLTANSLGGVPLMSQVCARLTAVEDGMRKFANQGQPSYGDISHGGCLTKRIASPDTDFHWWTIAELYKVAGSETVFTADIAHFQLQTLYTKMLIDFTVAVNLNHPERKISVQTLSSLVPQGYHPFVDDSGLEGIMRPQLRVIYNLNSIESSGIYLQLGMRLKGVAEETIAVADLSGPESCWRLIPTLTTAVLPEDDTLLLPSGVSQWDSLNPDSYQESQLIPLSTGHVCWAGSNALNRPNTGWKNITLDHFLEPEIDISKLRTAKLYLEESSASRFIIPLDLCGTNDSVTGVNTFTYANKSASLVYKIVRHQVTKVLTMSLSAEIVAGINSNPLNLRYVIVNS